MSKENSKVNSAGKSKVEQNPIVKKERKSAAMAKEQKVDAKDTSRIKIGTKMLMRYKQDIHTFVVLEDLGSTFLLRNDTDGVERKYMANIVIASLKKQAELKAAKTSDAAPADKSKDKPKKDIYDADGKIKLEYEKATEPKKKFNKFWEHESPIVSTLAKNEIRYYEVAKKLQLFSKFNDKESGDTVIAKGITLDVESLNHKDAMKVIANFVYALTSALPNDDRINNALELLEGVNMELNPEDYEFSKKELEDIVKKDGGVQLLKIASAMGVKVKQKSSSGAIILAILKAQSQRLADSDSEEEEE